MIFDADDPRNPDNNAPNMDLFMFPLIGVSILTVIAAILNAVWGA